MINLVLFTGNLISMSKCDNIYIRIFLIRAYSQFVYRLNRCHLAETSYNMTRLLIFNYY